MITDNFASLFDERLTDIEKDIQKENERENLNRMKARFFMFFFLIGADEHKRDMLERKVRDLLRNPDACEFIHITSDDAPESYGEKFEEVLLNAAGKHIDVQDLNNVFLCPVVFAQNYGNIDLVNVLSSIHNFVKMSGRIPHWQPFLVIDRSVSQYDNIYSSVSKIQKFIQTDDDCYINRCCLLSYLDGNGFTVPEENVMQTIAMTVVLQNVETQNAGASQTINSSVSIRNDLESRKNLFFTARNAAIINPIRSLTFQRICSAIDYFSGETDESCKNAVSRIDYSFVNTIVNPYLEKLPRYKGKVTFLPLYSVINDANVHNNLKDAIDHYYMQPLYGGNSRQERLQVAREEFLGRFFAANGSLSVLRELVDGKKLSSEFIQHSKNYLLGIDIENPIPNKSKLSIFSIGEYGNARKHCEELVRTVGTRLLDELSTDLCNGSISSAINDIEMLLKMIKVSVSNRIRTLRDVETVLVLDSSLTKTNFDEIQTGWMVEEASKDPNMFRNYNIGFDKIICAMLKQKDVGDIRQILDICYSAVKGKGYSNTEYLRRLHDECSRNPDKAKEFAGIVERSWCYTLRFLNPDQTGDGICIIGDSDNSFCKYLREKFNASLYSINGFDRIDVLHVSAPFDPSALREWEQIKQGRGETE